MHSHKFNLDIDAFLVLSPTSKSNDRSKAYKLKYKEKKKDIEYKKK